MMNSVEIKFTKNHGPNKVGDVVSVEQKVADWYIQNSIAQMTADQPSGCVDCDKKAKAKKSPK